MAVVASRFASFAAALDSETVVMLALVKFVSLLIPLANPLALGVFSSLLLASTIDPLSPAKESFIYQAKRDLRDSTIKRYQLG